LDERTAAALLAFANQVAQLLRDEAYRLDIDATGNTIASTVVDRFIEEGDKFIVSIVSSEYWLYIEQGRRAGARQPPLSATEAHIRNRAIQIRPRQVKTPKKRAKPGPTYEALLRSVAFAMARKIAEEGIAPRPFVDNVLNSQEYREAQAELTEEVGADIREQIAGILSTLGE